MPDFSTVLIWVLIVPILPAWLFQKLIPSHVEISGPLQGLLQGLNLKVVGGIAGYVFLAYMAWFVATDHIDRQIKEKQRDFERAHVTTGDRFEDWPVSGSIRLAETIGNRDAPKIFLWPDFRIEGGFGKGDKFIFEGRIPARHTVGLTRSPYYKKLVVVYDGYASKEAELRLDPKKGSKEIAIEIPEIVLDKLPDIDDKLWQDVNRQP